MGSAVPFLRAAPPPPPPAPSTQLLLLDERLRCFRARLRSLEHRVEAIEERERQTSRPPVAAVPVPEPADLLERLRRAAGAAGHVVYVWAAGGYDLRDRDGPVPDVGEEIEVAGNPPVVGHVLRVGPSPLPADTRRCAFLEPR